MPKYLYDEDKEETIRPLKTNTSKPKKKKSDHKHDYEIQEKELEFLLYNLDGKKTVSKVEICKVCGREGKRKWEKVYE
jgi:hypothetical protein